MKISFLGATRTVTGSNYLIETKSKKFIVDCGLFQGRAKETMLNTDEFQFDPTSIDFVLLTHAHIDHSGRIPKLFKDGYKNPIVCTKATCDLCTIMLPDSGHIQEVEIEWTNRKRKREGKHLIEPIYTAQDALDCLKLFNPVKYDEIIEIDETIKVRFNEAGHMLGSSMIEVWIYEDGKEEKIVFSGDVGKSNHPIIRDRSKIEEADYLVMESTYGARLHKHDVDNSERLIDIIVDTIDKGGNIVIPSFAVGRTQEMLYEIFKSRHNNIPGFDEKLKKILDTKVYVDSPLATSATKIFRDNIDIFDEEAREFIENGEIPIEFPGLEFVKSAEDSRALNETASKAIIISASGMCEVGRIKHHLKHNLWKENSTILFVGYQAEGTLGRKIIEGAKRVKIFGEEISVNARIEYIEGFSGHADQEGLLNLVSEYTDKLKKIFIVHGEYEGQKVLSELINTKYRIETEIPDFGEVFEIKDGIVTKVGELKPKDAYRYVRLELVDRLETLKEELEEMAIYVKQDIKNNENDQKVQDINTRIVEMEKQIIEILKM